MKEVSQNLKTESLRLGAFGIYEDAGFSYRFSITTGRYLKSDKSEDLGGVARTQSRIPACYMICCADYFQSYGREN